MEAVSRSECHQPEVGSKSKKQLSDNLERPFPMEKWIRNQTWGLESRQVADEDGG